jgi:hypothetical protein
MIKEVNSTFMMPVGGIHVMEVTEVDCSPIRRLGGVLNVYTGQNPRRHVVFIEIQPNAYYNYLP